MMDFKAREGAVNMFIPSMIGFIFLTKNLNRKDLLRVPKKMLMMTNRVKGRILPSFPASSQIGESFTKWLTGSGGGCKKDHVAQHIVKRCFKYLKFCCED